MPSGAWKAHYDLAWDNIGPGHFHYIVGIILHNLQVIASLLMAIHESKNYICLHIQCSLYDESSKDCCMKNLKMKGRLNRYELHGSIVCLGLSTLKAFTGY